MCGPAAPAAAGAATSATTAAATSAAMMNMMYISLAISAATSAVSFAAQQQQASQQASYQKKMGEAHNTAAEQNAKFATQEFIDQNAAENMSLIQKQEATSAEIQRIERKKKEAAGTAVASSEGAGQSLAFLLADYERQEARYKDTVRTQLEMDTVQRDNAVKGHRKTAVNRGKSQQGYIAQPINRPNPLGATLGFAGKAFQAYDTYSEHGKRKLFT